MNYRWDFPIKTKNMDKPTSDKDVIKSLPPEKERKIHGMTPNEYRERNRLIGDSIPLFKIKPVFDKMLAALKSVVACEDDEGGDRSEDERYRIVYEAIKEAEELGL